MLVRNCRAASRTAAIILVLLMVAVSLAAGEVRHGRAEKTDFALPPDSSVTIRVDVPLVLIDVTVTDPVNRLVTGLDKGHFSIWEDKALQEIKVFGAEDAPLSLGFIFDASGSMGEKISQAREAVSEFLKLTNPHDEFFLILFNNRPELAIDFTSRLAEVQNRLTFTESKGRTALLDAIYLGIDKMREASNAKKALLVLSDGGDNSSRYAEREIKRMVREADVQIYAIGIFESQGYRGRTPEELAGPRLLTEVAEQTGGREFSVKNLNELPDIVTRIGMELRNQYVLGYVPANQERDGKWRRLKVEVKKIRGMPPLRAHFRLGYYAPSR